MLARKYGRIVNISSVTAILGRASVAGYVAAKHGLVGLTKNLAAEYGPHVTANAIAPGYIRTKLNIALQENKEFNAMLEQRTAAHRWGKPEDLRGPLLLLASDAGAYMTGHTLLVDGGLRRIWRSTCFHRMPTQRQPHAEERAQRASRSMGCRHCAPPPRPFETAPSSTETRASSG